MKKLATDIDDFEKIITEDFLYIDKTKFLAKIIESGTYYFLSRPRRFGKSLFLDTIEKFYQGKKELFQGLYIYNFDWDWEEYPVLRLDFNRLEHSTTENLKIEIEEFLNNYADRYNLKLTSTLLSSRFEELIVKMNTKTNKKVVVLIDEYDKAVISHLSQDQKEIEIAKENQNFLKTLYDNLKPLGKYLELVFITGISKFSKLSIFSTLNNLNELDMHPNFSHMLGYTEKELHNNFEPYFEEFASKKEISKTELYQEFKQMYNGFRFSDENIKVYNPYSIARALEAKKIDNYWFESGTPSFLVELIKSKKMDVSKLQNIEVGKDELKAYDIEKLELISILFQTGYLTIKEIEDQIIYKLGYPNLEVKKGFNLNLAKSFSKNKITVPVVHRLKKLLVNKNIEEFIEQIKSIFSNLVNINIPKSLQDREAYYNSLFYLITTLLTDNNLNVHSEVLTSDGRIDMSVETETNIYIIEFKANQDAELALQQIKDKNYAERFKIKEKGIILIGINFDTKKRNIKNIKIEEID